ncbi:MAG: hypothetical protein AAGE52_11735 [Myxococcota bacterium]
MGFRVIAGQLRFPEGNSEAWLRSQVDLLGFREPGAPSWPPMSRFVRLDVTMLGVDVARSIEAERHGSVRDHLERAKELTTAGEVRIADDLVEWRLRTRTKDPDLVASSRYVLCFCVGALVSGALGELLAFEGRASRDREGKRTYALQLRNGEVQAWTPSRSLGRRVVQAIGEDAELPALTAPAEARLR